MFRSKYRLSRKVPSKRKFFRGLLALEQLENRLAMDATVVGTANIDNIRVSPGPTANSVRVSSENGTFAPRVFNNLSGTLFLQPGGGEDTITIDPLGARFSGNVVVTDPANVTLRNIDLTGSLTVNAGIITAANGSRINTRGDIQLVASSQSSLTFPLSQIGLKDRENTARINIGSATLTGRNIKLTSDAGATRIAKAEYNQNTRAMVLGDVNGDQLPDLIVANSDPATGVPGGPLMLFLNTGKADPFEGSIPVTISRGGNMTSLALGDVNGDRKPDLVVGSSVNPNSPNTAVFSRLFLNTGSADLPFRDVSGRAFNIGSGKDYTNAVALGDLDSDGDLDLVLGNGVGISSGQVAFPTASRVILNTGGTNPFTGLGSTLGLATANTQAIAIADVNGDGKPDLITGNAAYSTGVAPNTVRVLSPSRVYVNSGTATPLSGDGIALTGTGNDVITSLAVGDANGDTKPDIVLGNDGKPTRLFLSSAAGTALTATMTSLGGNEATKGVTLVDANGDGRLDLVVANAGTSRVYLGTGLATPFSTAVDLGEDGAQSKGTIAVAAADMNGDGRQDLVLGTIGGPTQVYVNDGSARPYVDANTKAVSLDPTLTSTIDLPAYDQLNVLASVVRAKATANVNIASGAVLTASQDVLISSTAIADARNTTVGMMVGLTFGSAEPTATVALASGASVTAGGLFDFQAKANALLDVSVITLAPAFTNIDLAFGKANAISSATLSTGSTVTAGRVSVAATNTNTLSTAAGGYNLSLGGPVSGGIGVAISEYNSSAKALVNGTLNATVTDAFIDAKSVNVKDSTIGTASVIGTADVINLIRSLLKGISNKLSASAKSASKLSGGSKQGTISSFLSTAPSDFSAVGLAAGIAIPESTNAAEARIGSRAVVTVKRNLRLNSRAEDNFKVTATGDSGGSSVADLGGGVAVATLSNTAISSFDGGADVQVDGQTRVMSNAVYPNPVNSAIPGFRFVPPSDITNTPTNNDADRIANGFQMGQALTDGLQTFVMQTVVPVVKGILLGDPSAVGTSFVKGTGGTSDGGKLGIGGGVNILNITNNSTAQIGTGAKVNQRTKADVNLPSQDVWVDADSTIITMNFGNQASALNIKSAGAGAGGAAAFGGQFEYISYTNGTKAIIEDGAKVSAKRDIKVNADTFNYLLTVAQAGAKAAKVGVGGTMVFHEMRNQTLAYAEDGAVLDAKRDVQVLANNELQVFNAGGGIILGSTAGVGVSVAANFLQQNDTWAFIGDNNRVLGVGSVTAGQNMDVKANADTVVIDLAISGSVADGLPPAIDQPKGPEAFSSFAAWEEALTKYGNSLNAKGGVGVSGDATLNVLTSDTRAFIIGSSGVTVGGNLTVDAKDTGLFAAASGAVAYGNAVGIGGSLAVNSVRRNTLATIDRTLVNAGGVSILANSIETPVTVTVGAGLAKQNAAVAGSLSITDVVSDVKAMLGRSSTVTTNRAGSTITEGGSLNVQANRVSNNYSVAGVVSAALNASASVGLAVDLALQDGEVLASINSPVTSAGNVRVYAADSQKLFGVAAGLSAAINDGAGVAGSVAVDKIKQVAKAAIAPNMRVNAEGTVRVDADGLLQNIRIAGSVGGGKRAGVGGAFTINLVPDRLIQAEIGSNATVSGSGNRPAVVDPQDLLRASRGVAVDANTTDRSLLFAAAGGISAGTLGLAGSAIGDSISNSKTEAVIRSGARINQAVNPNVLQDLTVSANHDTSVLSVAGSIAGAKTVGVGAAVVTETIERNVLATLEQNVNAKAARFITVDATSSLPITSVAGAVAGAVNGAAAAGSVVVETLTTNTKATVGQNGLNNTVTLAAGAIRVWADSDSQQTTVAGVASGSLGAGIGASNVTIIQTNATQTHLANKTSVTTTGVAGLTAPNGRRSEQGELLTEPFRGIAAIATANEDITTVAAGASGGKVGLAGSVTVTTWDLNTTSSIGEDAVINAPIRIVAHDDTNITGGGGAGGGGLYTGVGAGIDVQTVKKSVLATLLPRAIVTPTAIGDVAIRALSTGNQLSISAAIAAGGYAGVAGGASGIDSNNSTQAILGGRSRVTAFGNVVVTAEDTSSATGIAGSVGASAAAGVGASVGVAIVKKNTSAILEAGNVVVANQVPNLATTVADGGFAIADQIAVGGLFDPRNDINAPLQTFKLDAAHNFTAGAGQAVQYSSGGGTAVPGLVNGRTYYVIVVDALSIKLATTAQKAKAGIADVFPQAVAVSATHSFTPIGQGPIPVRDGVDVVGDQLIRDILNRRGLAPTQRAVQGVAVTAVNLGRIESYAASAGAGLAAVPISSAVDVLTSIVNARIDVDASVQANDVLVAAGNELLHLGVGGAIGVNGGATVAPGIHVPNATLETRAVIDDFAKITATQNVEVLANANQDILSFAMGLSRGFVAVGGSVGVLTLKSTTLAEIGSSAVVIADGSVGVESYDVTNTAMLTGAAAAGGPGGLGGSVAVVYIDKDNRALLGADTKIDARGFGNSEFSSVAIDPNGRIVFGVLVQAKSQQNLFGVALAGAIGSYGALAGAVTVATVNASTTADVGDRAKINTEIGSSSAVSFQDVVVYADDATLTRAFTGALAIGASPIAIGGLAGGVDVGLFNPIVLARVGAAAIVKAKQDLAISGNSTTNVQSAAASAAGGQIGVAGAVSVYALGSGLSNDAKRSLNANDAGNTATAGGYVDDVARAQQVNDLFGKYLTNPDSSEADKRAAQFLSNSATTFQASLPTGRATRAIATTGSGRISTLIATGSSLSAGRTAIIDGTDNVTTNQTSGTVAGGIGAFGGAVSIATANHIVDVKVEGSVAAIGNVFISSAYDSNLNGGAGAGLGSSNGVTVGLVGIGAQVTRFTDNSSNSTLLSGAVTNADTLTVRAVRNRLLSANAQGVTVGGVVAGVASAHGIASGNTTATITGQVGQAFSQQVTNLNLIGDSTSQIFANTKAVAAGVLSGAGSDTVIAQNETGSGAFVRNARIKTGLDATIRGSSRQFSGATADGINVGGATMGASQSIGTLDATGRVVLSGNTVLDIGRDLDTNASAETKSILNATASGGGVLSFGDSTRVEAALRPTSELVLDGAGVQISAGRNVNMLSETIHFNRSVARSDTYGLFGTGRTQAAEARVAKTRLDVQGAVITAAANITMEAKSTDRDSVGGATSILTALGSSPTVAISLPLLQTDLNFGLGARVNAGGTLFLNAQTIMDEDVTTDGSLRALGDGNATAQTTHTLLTNVSLGNAQLVANDIVARAISRVTVSNFGSARIAGIQSNLVLTQFDTVTNHARVTSAVGGSLRARSWNPLAEAGVSADGLTNGAVRNTVNQLDRQQQVDMKGQVIIV